MPLMLSAFSSSRSRPCMDLELSKLEQTLITCFAPMASCTCKNRHNVSDCYTDIPRKARMGQLHVKE